MQIIENGKTLFSITDKKCATQRKKDDGIFVFFIHSIPTIVATTSIFIFHITIIYSNNSAEFKSRIFFFSFLSLVVRNSFTLIRLLFIILTLSCTHTWQHMMQGLILVNMLFLTTLCTLVAVPESLMLFCQLLSFAISVFTVHVTFIKHVWIEFSWSFYHTLELCTMCMSN